MPPKSATLSIDLKSSEAGFLRSLGSHLYVPVPVQPLVRPSVVWLNHRWFLQQGIDTLQPEIRASTDAWLLKSFALKTGTSGARPIYPGHMRIAQSDRYGGSGGTAHGGSGRTITVGNFNAKGVGPTPLVPSAAEQGYSSGFMPLREAIREAIMSEIAQAELPYGAVPTICIIDAAEEFSFDSAYGEEPRAIAVRPNFARPAHFERSIFFGTAGFEGSDQQVDALRVCRAVREAISWEQRTRDGLFDPAKMFARLGRQIGVARAHRLWLGAFLTSNASVSGACVDFGSFRAVANWFRVYGLSYEVFGAEEEQMAGAIQSVCHYFNKYGSVSPPLYNVEEIKGAVSQSIAAGFREGCAIGLGVDEAGEEAEKLSALFLEYYHAQQHRSVLVDGAPAYRGSWIYDQLRPARRQAEKPPMQEGRAGAAIVQQISALQGGVGHVSAPSRWLRPRPILYYNLLNARTRTAANLAREEGTSSDLIFDHVTRCLTAGRRVWRDLPRDLDVVDQHVQPHLAILGCVRRETGEKLLWVEAFETDGRVHLHEKSVPWSEVERYFLKRTGNQLSLLFPWEAGEVAGLRVSHIYRYQYG